MAKKITNRPSKSSPKGDGFTFSLPPQKPKEKPPTTEEPPKKASLAK